MIITLTGPSGIGKGFVVKHLLERLPCLQQMTWLTTRPLRQGEETAGNRRSVTRDEFERLAKTGLLTLVQEVHGNLYGLEFGEHDYSQGHWVCELHIDNVTRVKEMNLPILSIALLPTDIEFLGTRLRMYRGTESESEIRRRLASAENEIAKIVDSSSVFDALFFVSPENENRVAEDVVAAIAGAKGFTT